jgi:putative peptidoglycan lipid II flippase
MTAPTTDRPPTERSVAGNSATVAGWTVISRATGFLRVVAIAAVLGPTYFGNAFQGMNLLPNAAYELLAGGLISAIIVPALITRLDRRDAAAVERIAGGFLGSVLVLFGAAAVILIAAGPLVPRLLMAGVTDPEALRLQQRLGWLLLVLVVPQLLCYGIVGTAAAVQNAHGRFALAASAPVIENVGVVVTVVSSAVVFGTGLDLEQVTTAHVVWLGAGATTSVLLHAGVQWWGAWRCGVRLVPRAGWRDPDVRQLAKVARPSLGIASLLGIRYLGILVVAGSVPGGVVAFTMAVNFFNLPVALGAKPVAAAILPALSRLVRRGLAQFRDEFARGMGLAFLVTVPAAVGLVLLAPAIARAAAYGEMSDATGVRLIALSLAFVGLGVIGETAFVVSTPASYALGDARRPLVATLVRTVVTLPGMVLSLVLLDGPWVLAGLGAALTVGDLAAGGLLWRGLVSRMPAATHSAVRSLGRCLLAALVALVPVAAALEVLEVPLAGQLLHVATLTLAGLTAAVIYLVAQWALGAPELHAPFARRARASGRTPC